MPKHKINDINLYYESTGEGPTLLFIHGLGSSTRDWEQQVDSFSKQYQVITVDLRGHGRSDKPPGPYSIRLFAEDLAELVRSLDIAPVHVIGISLGGMVALELTVDFPELVESTVVVNSGPEFIVRTIKERLMFLQRVLIVRLLGMRKMGEVLSKRLFIKPEHENIRQTFVERWAENNQRAYLDAMNAIVGWSVRDQLDEITCPVLIIAADEDYTPVESKQVFVEKIPDCELVVIDDSRHATPAERPQAFNQALASFLSRVSK